MDEYVCLPEKHPESYHAYMWDNFFKHIDILCGSTPLHLTREFGRRTSGSPLIPLSAPARSRAQA